MNWVGQGVELGGSTDENLTPFFCSNSIFGAPLCSGSEISTTFFKTFFHNRLYILREQWRLLNPAALAVAGERRPLQGRFFNGRFSGAFFATGFFNGL